MHSQPDQDAYANHSRQSVAKHTAPTQQLSVFGDFRLEGFRDQHVNQNHNAERQNEQRQFLHLHRVFLLCRLVPHNDISFAQARPFENSSTVGGTPVT